MKERCKCGTWSCLDHDACPKCGKQVDVHACEKCAASVMIWDDRCYACRTPNQRFKAKHTHGGKRPNAGRKPAETPRKAITVRLSEPARDRLHQLKRETGKSFTAILEAFLTP